VFFIILYNITIIAYNHHTDTSPLLNIHKNIYISGSHDVPASPSPKQISDLLQKIHAVYDAVITDEVTMVRSVKAYLYSEASHEEMITRSILCVLFPIWLGMTVYSTGKYIHLYIIETHL